MQTLEDVAGGLYPAFKREQTGFLDSLVSDINTSGTEQLQLEQGDGKNKQVSLRYIQPGTMDETSDEKRNVCDDGTTYSPTNKLITVTRQRSSPILEFTKAQMRDFCEGSQEWRSKILMSHMNAFFRSINRDLIGTYEANVGKFYDQGAGAKTINLLNEDAGGRISADASGEVEIMEDFENIGFAGTPIVVGADHLSKYAKYQKIGCCNMWGQQINQLGNLLYYRDKDVDNIIGSQLTSPTDKGYIIAYAPGAIQFITHLENKGEFATIDGTSMEITATDPFSGIEFDLEMYYDRCTKTYKVVANLNYDIFYLPDDMYKEADDRYLTNFSLLFKSELS